MNLIFMHYLMIQPSYIFYLIFSIIFVIHRLKAHMEQLSIFGAPTASGDNPEMVTSQVKDQSETLLDVMVETNPLDGLCDTRIRVNSKPLEVIYDAVSVACNFVYSSNLRIPCITVLNGLLVF